MASPQLTTVQPRASTEMSVIGKPSGDTPNKQACEQKQKASHLRGGGGAKDCFLTCVGCFLCSECCEGCCECIADIICCPCEVCC